MWFKILGNKNKEIHQDENGALITNSNILNTNIIELKKPKGLLEIEILKNKKYIPHSIGFDKFIYGLNNGNKRMIRTNNGFDAVEYGYDFFALDIGTPEFVTRTRAGFVVYVNHKDNLTASVWFSQAFDTGFEKVLDLTNGYVAGAFVPRPIHFVDNGILMVAEYSIAKDPLKPCRCWISRKGGIADSWELINTVETVNSEENAHFHAYCYDPFQSRIYTSKGDYSNRKMEYSDDWGKTWNVIDTNTQPTLLEPLRKRIVTCPDFGDVVSVNTIEKCIDGNYTSNPYFKKQINIANISAYGNFGKGCVGGLVGSDEMYVTFSESGSGVKKCFVVGTGDGGESWHLLQTFEPTDGNGLVRGLVTDPNTGYMYGYYLANVFGDGSWEHIAKVKPVEWV